jgi:hypothetical protein
MASVRDSAPATEVAGQPITQHPVALPRGARVGRTRFAVRLQYGARNFRGQILKQPGLGRQDPTVRSKPRSRSAFLSSCFPYKAESTGGEERRPRQTGHARAIAYARNPGGRGWARLLPSRVFETDSARQEPRRPFDSHLRLPWGRPRTSPKCCISCIRFQSATSHGTFGTIRTIPLVTLQSRTTPARGI